MKRYSKGARSERELLGILESNNFSVIRAAGSGVSSTSPDIVGIRNGKGVAFECKAWEKSNVSIEIEKLEMLKKWQENTGMETMIAWRMNGKGWFFIKLEEMKKTERSYTITKNNAMAISRKIEAIIGIF